VRGGGVNSVILFTGHCCVKTPVRAEEEEDVIYVYICYILCGFVSGVGLFQGPDFV
jgi:hypothetical protein